MSSIGQAITGIAGAVIGAYMGGPSGAFMGASIGLSLGGILFPASTDTANPSPSGLQLQTSQLGIVIPVVYGARKVSGNLIWYGDFQSNENTAEVGKGGGETVVTGYSYTVGMAWGLSMVSPDRPLTVRQVWAGKDLITPDKYRIYDGTQTEPDSYIAGFTARAPVWKNLCYVVMESYPLGGSPYIPQFNFETALIPVNYGTVWTIGTSSSGSSGRSAIVSTFTQAGSITDWVSFNMSMLNSVGIRRDGTLWGFGGQYIICTSVQSSTPVQIGADNDWMDISWGTQFAVAIKTNGTMWSWGHSQSYGELGTGIAAYSTVTSPTQIGSDTDWVEVDCCSQTTIARKTNGTLWGWGKNNGRQLGISVNTTRSTPVLIGNGLTTWNAIYAHSESVHATQSDGSLWGWGQNSYGEIANGTTVGVNVATPVMITATTKWVKISGRQCFVGLTDGGTIWGCGPAVYGPGDNISRSSMIQVGTRTDWIDISAAESCALYQRADGSVWGTGYTSKFGFLDGLVWLTPVQLGTETDWTNVMASYANAGVMRMPIPVGSDDDLPPTDITRDILTNPQYGLGIPSAYLNTLNFGVTEKYCIDNDLLLSIYFQNQMSVLDALTYVLRHHDGYIAYYDGQISHHQKQYVTPTQSISSATNDFVEKSDFPVSIVKGGNNAYNNKIFIEYTKRAADYVIGMAVADDLIDIDTYGLKDLMVKLDSLCVYSRAEKMAWSYLRQSQFSPQSLKFKLGPKSKLLAIPGNIITITDTATEIAAMPIRLLTIKEDTDGTIEIEAIEENESVYDVTLRGYATPPELPGSITNLRDPAESMTSAIGFYVPEYYAGADRCVMVVTTKPSNNPSWAGASVYQAYSLGGPYTRKTSNSGSGVIGTVQEVGTESGTAYITVLLDTDATLTSVLLSADMDTNPMLNLFYDAGLGLFGRFQTVELVGVNTWKLTDLQWDTTGTLQINSYGTMSADDELAFYQGTMNLIPLLPTEADMTLYYKTPSFNMYGVEQSLADVEYIEVIIPPMQSVYLLSEAYDHLLTESGDVIMT